MSSKSVRDGSVPGWMKNSTENSINLNDLSSMSPPDHSEPFFHIRLPISRRTVTPQTPDSQSSSSIIGSTSSLDPDIESLPAVDLSKECKKYYAGLENATPANFHISKPKGTDDEFKSAVCAGSLMKITQKFVGGNSGKQLQKRFTVAKIEEHDDHAPPLDTETYDMFRNDPHLMQRRNSRSLPTSPMQSPKTMRKFNPQPNPYFTITGGSDEQPPKQSWFLTSLFGVRRELTTSTMSVSSQIVDEAEEVIPETTTSSTPIPISENAPTKQTSNVMASFTNNNNNKKETGASSDTTKPQPTMLREMNFWTPTSY